MIKKRKGLTLIELVVSMILISILTFTTTKIFDTTLKTYNKLLAINILEEETYTSIVTFEKYFQNYNYFKLISDNDNFKELIIYKTSPDNKNDAFVIKLKNNKLSFGGKSDEGISYTNLLCQNIHEITMIFLDNSILQLKITSKLDEQIYTQEKLINVKYKEIER